MFPVYVLLAVTIHGTMSLGNFTSFRHKIATGDLSKSTRYRRAVTAYSSRVWPNATIPYKFDFSLPEELRELLVAAIDHWHNKTCIVFKEKTRNDEDFVYFTSESCGCCSSVGRVGGRQSLSLKDYCANSGVAIHELGHVVGFWHEHTRPDRDSFIKILWNNIYKDKHDNFLKRQSTEIHSFRRPYDIFSVMHYSPTTFSNGKGHTMVGYNGVKLGHQATSLSVEDILQARLLYGCPEPNCSFWIDATSSGNISSPYYPNRYTADLDCQWTIHVPKGRYINLKFDKFELQDSFRCSADYLEIREVNSTGKVVARLCGSGVPPSVASTASLWLTFHSNWFIEKQGFSLLYNSQDIKPVDLLKLNRHFDDFAVLMNEDCVRMTKSKHGVFHTVEIPTGLLKSRVICSFVIDGSASTVGRLTLRLSTNQSRAYGNDCLGDIYQTFTDADFQHLGIFESSGDDGEMNLDTSRWQQLGYICMGKDKPIDIHIEQQMAYILWTSERHRALTLEYWIDYDECALVSPCDQVCENTFDGYQCSCENGFRLEDGHRCVQKVQQLEDECYQNLTAHSGKIISTTEPNIHCSYNIVRPAHKIILTFIKLRLPHSGNCDLNRVEVKSNKNLIANLCNNLNDFELTAGESMTILQYMSNRTLILPFFVAEYTSLLKQTDECELRLDGSGEITTPNYPQLYEPNIHCSWKLRTSKGKRLLLTVTDIDIEYTDGCEFDRIQIYNGRNRRSPLLTTLCGDSNKTIASTGHHVAVVFTSDSSGSGRGFKITVTDFAEEATATNPDLESQH